MKNDEQPIRYSVPWNSRCTKDPHWLNNVFPFGTEIWADQSKKKHPAHSELLVDGLMNEMVAKSIKTTSMMLMEMQENLNVVTLFKVPIIGILEEIDPFIDEKCTSWKCAKKWAGPSPLPHSWEKKMLSFGFCPNEAGGRALPIFLHIFKRCIFRQ